MRHVPIDELPAFTGLTCMVVPRVGLGGTSVPALDVGAKSIHASGF